MRATGRTSLTGSSTADPDQQPPKAAAVGRSNLNKQLAQDTAAPSMFGAGAPQWEAIDAEIELPPTALLRGAEGEAAAHHDAAPTVEDEVEDPDGALEEPAHSSFLARSAAAPASAGGGDHEDAQAASPEAATVPVTARAASAGASPAAAPASPAGPTATAASTTAVAPKGAAHKAPYERSGHHHAAHYAKQDKYNKKSIKSPPHNNDNEIRRPGVRVGAHDEFKLKGTTASRYRIVKGNHAQHLDDVNAADIANGARLALNPAHSRKLVINGHAKWCVMSWYGTQGSAWIELAALAGNTSTIKRAVDKKAKQWDPATASTKHASKFHFRAAMDPIARNDATDKTTFIKAGQKSDTANHTADYLGHDIMTSLPSAANPTPGTRHDYNVSMNLPSKSAPPVAIDIAAPGDVFFVPKGKTFRREISTFEQGKSKVFQLQTWVYGFVGKMEKGKVVPDKSRRGWVPLRVLKNA